MYETVAKYNSQGTDHYSSTARGSWRILIVSQKNLPAPTGTGKFTFFLENFDCVAKKICLLLREQVNLPFLRDMKYSPHRKSICHIAHLMLEMRRPTPLPTSSVSGPFRKNHGIPTNTPTPPLVP